MFNESGRAVRRWLFVMCFLIAAMVVVGGYVRLTRSGLSIVEWDVITGIAPPIGEEAWQETFAKYRQTPEYQKINAGMTLTEYRSIYYVEYIHRMIGRLVGLAFALPLLAFLLTGAIPWRKSGPYAASGLLFAFQGFFGWYMVQSGLVDQPRVSQYRLTTHLLIALTLLALCLWLGLRRTSPAPAPAPRPVYRPPRGLALALLLALVVQIAYGGLVAGLRAGYISDTFPLMFGAWVPAGLLSAQQPWFVNLLANMATVHFVHRWLAFFVLALAIALYILTRRRRSPRLVCRLALAAALLASLQTALGIGVILFHVPISLALVHQATGIALFATALLLNYRVRAKAERRPARLNVSRQWAA